MILNEGKEVRGRQGDVGDNHGNKSLLVQKEMSYTERAQCPLSGMDLVFLDWEECSGKRMKCTFVFFKAGLFGWFPWETYAQDNSIQLTYL